MPTTRKASRFHDWLFFQLERETRFELATFSLATRHSTTELLPHIVCRYQRMVGKRRLELLRLAAPDPKSGVSAISPLAHALLSTVCPAERKGLYLLGTQMSTPGSNLF